MTRRILWLCLAFLAGCASRAPGTQPGDMSASEHERHAAGHEREAAAHQSQFSASAATTHTSCPGAAARADEIGPCWTSRVNPTEAHQREADEHRRVAAQHREASQALRDAEARACVGISEADRDTSPFEHREDIASVAPLYEQRAMGRTATQQQVGVIVTVRAVPGLTAEWLQRLVDCHLARAAALGNSMPEMAHCPLVPRGVERAVVTSASGGFAVEIHTNPEALPDVRRRAESLVGSAAPPAASHP